MYCNKIYKLHVLETREVVPEMEPCNGSEDGMSTPSLWTGSSVLVLYQLGSQRYESMMKTGERIIIHN